MNENHKKGLDGVNSDLREPRSYLGEKYNHRKEEINGQN